MGRRKQINQSAYFSIFGKNATWKWPTNICAKKLNKLIEKSNSLLSEIRTERQSKPNRYDILKKSNFENFIWTDW